MAKEFIGFLKEYGVIGLAIAVVIGGKVNAFITSLVNDLLMPALFQPLLKAANVDKLAELHFNGIYYGKVVSSLIDFVIVAFIVFFFAKKVLKEEKVAKK